MASFLRSKSLSLVLISLFVWVACDKITSELWRREIFLQFNLKQYSRMHECSAQKFLYKKSCKCVELPATPYGLFFITKIKKIPLHKLIFLIFFDIWFNCLVDLYIDCFHIVLFTALGFNFSSLATFKRTIGCVDFSFLRCS